MLHKLKIFLIFLAGFGLTLKSINQVAFKDFSKNQSALKPSTTQKGNNILFTENIDSEDDTYYFENENSEDDKVFEIDHINQVFKVISPKNNFSNFPQISSHSRRIKIFILICSLKLLA